MVPYPVDLIVIIVAVVWIRVVLTGLTDVVFARSWVVWTWTKVVFNDLAEVVLTGLVDVVGCRDAAVVIEVVAVVTLKGP